MSSPQSISIKNISLENFRSHSNKTIAFKRGINVILGPNGTGKTNIIEAIYFLCLNSSFKTSHKKNIIKFNESGFKVDAKLTLNRKILSLNCSSTKSPDSNDLLKVILFSPESTNIINSTPQVRRMYIDDIIKQYDKKYADILSKYSRIVKQRSEIFKNGRQNAHVLTELEFWNDQFAIYSENITTKRMNLISSINQKIGQIYKKVACLPDADLKVTLLSSPTVPKKSEILKSINDDFEREKILGFTTIGAKGDDITFELNSNVVKGNCSYGEQWSIMISFVLAVWEILRQADESFGNVEPILLLDDAFTGLDQSRREHLVNLLKPIGQCIITSADLKDIPKMKYNQIDILDDGVGGDSQ
jgi:DNA replication and repair protein RecF